MGHSKRPPLRHQKQPSSSAVPAVCKRHTPICGPKIPRMPPEPGPRTGRHSSTDHPPFTTPTAPAFPEPPEDTRSSTKMVPGAGALMFRFTNVSVPSALMTLDPHLILHFRLPSAGSKHQYPRTWYLYGTWTKALNSPQPTQIVMSNTSFYPDCDV